MSQPFGWFTPFRAALTDSKRDAFEIVGVLETFDRSIKDRYVYVYNFVRLKKLKTIVLESPSPIVTRIHQCAPLTTGDISEIQGKGKEIASARELAN